MRPTLSLLTVATAVLLAGCSFEAHIDTRWVSADEVEKTATAMLTEQVGRAPDSIECPEDLPARVGAEVRCILTDGDQRYGVAVEVTGLGEGSHVDMFLEVDEQPADAGS